MKKNRFKQILHQLSTHGSLQVVEIAEQLNVSPMTIRRDLRELEARSLLIRTHGGAIASHLPTSDIPFSFRSSINRELKEEIAHAAASTVYGGERLFLASGSTVTAFSNELSSKPDLTIITDSVNIAYTISSKNSAQVVIIGGAINPTTMATEGMMTENMIDSFTYDAAYLGATAIGLDGQIYLGSLSELGIMRKLLSMACRIYILADHTKLGKSDFVKAGNLKPNFTLITDHEVPESILADLKKVHSNIIIASPHTSKDIPQL